MNILKKLKTKKSQDFFKAKTDNLNKSFKDDEKKELSGTFKTDLDLFNTIFEGDDSVKIQQYKIPACNNLEFCLVFCDSLVNSQLIAENVLKPLLNLTSDKISLDINNISMEVIETGSNVVEEDMHEILKGLLGGDTFIFIDGFKKGILIGARTFPTRGISEPEGEKILSGPREGFTESINQNIGMLRRKIKSPKLKIKYLTFGKQTNTLVAVSYIDGVVNKNVLTELYKRLEKIDIDSVLDANYITELIHDDNYSPYRTVGYSERPDVVAAKILEGRVCIMVDGTPVVLTVPYLFVENFQSNEDYYLNFYYTSFSRILRIIGFLMTILIPGLYIAIVAFHQEVLPSSLIISIAHERQNVPLPAAIECFLMLFVFDILRETGIRMPTSVGQALSIVGALVIGQAASEAKLVASPMIIVVAITGITSLLVPKMNAPLIYTRILILILSSLFGLLGLTIGFSLCLVHILSLKSFGISQFTNLGKLNFQNNKDLFIRAPWTKMKKRPKSLSDNSTRKSDI